MSTDLIVFVVLGSSALLGALGVVVAKDPVRSAMGLVVNLISLALIYFSLNAQMIGITQIMIYVGAIMVLFLFVVMLLSTGGAETHRRSRDIKTYLAVASGIGLFFLLSRQVILPFQNYLTPNAPDQYGTPKAIGQTLFSLYVLPFEILSLLLLVGVVGAILLAKRRF